MPREVVRFLRNGQVVEVAGVDPCTTLLDHLRLRERACGTKEGCAEGDCGACTVALGSLRDGTVRYEPVNSCIHLLGMVDGKEVVAVEDLAGRDGTLHPVQRALVDAHGSQCGFCTPGFVMSLFTLYHAGQGAHAGIAPARTAIDDWLAGNLCRCTGYRPIVDAARAACGGPPDDAFARRAGATARALASLQDDAPLVTHAGGSPVPHGSSPRFFAAPADEAQLAELYLAHPRATLVAGATDVGLWITKALRDLPQVIHLGRVQSLRAVTADARGVRIGAAATYAEAESALAGIDPDLGELLRRLGSKQVRAAGTVGGNVANGSPIGDMPPALVALGATLALRRGDARREMPLEDFFVDYGRQDIAPGEFLTAIEVPRLAPDQHFRCYKISKRFDQDISALLGAFRLTVRGGEVAEARIAFGGMAATVRRAPLTEAALAGLRLEDTSGWEAAAARLDRDFAPIDDLRASAAYRARTARALLARARMEIRAGDTRATRLTGHRVLANPA